MIVAVWGYDFSSVVYGSVLGYIFSVGEVSPLPSTKTVKRVLFSGHPPLRGHPATPRQLGGILGYKGSVCIGWDC